jgi:hypothetical protein
LSTPPAVRRVERDRRQVGVQLAPLQRTVGFEVVVPVDALLCCNLQPDKVVADRAEMDLGGCFRAPGVVLADGARARMAP